MENSKVKLPVKIGYGIGATGKSMSYGLANGFISLYFLEVLGLSSGYLAVMFLVSRIWDGVNDLLMGAIIDATKTKWGKFRPWMLLGGITNAIVTVLLFYKPPIEGVMLYVYVTIMYVLWDMTYTMVDVSYWSLIPALTNDPHERDIVSLIPRICGAAGGLFTSFLLNIVDALGGRTVNGGFLKYAAISSAVFAVTMAVCSVYAKENVAGVRVSDEKFSLINSAKILFGNKQALVIVAIMIFFNLANNLTGNTAMYYFIYVLKQDSNFWMYSIFSGAAQGIGLLGFPLFSKWFGRMRVYKFSLILPCFGYLFMFLCGQFLPTNLIVFILAVCVMSVGFGSMNVMQNVMLADAVDYGEWQNGKRSEGVIFSMLTFLSKIATALSSFIVMITFSITGFDAQSKAMPSAEAVMSIKALLYCMPPVILVLALIVLIYCYKLTPEYMAKINCEIEEKKKLTSDVIGKDVNEDA
ncbi:MAG: glycoside-pentoside-hexuronide (GPH):cation symporter [Eubacterium sp.]